jgi:hypothetical protein
MQESGRHVKALLFVSISLLFFAMTYGLSSANFTLYDLGFIVALMTLVFALQVVIGTILIKKPFYQNCFLTVFGLANITSLNLLVQHSFLSLPHFAVPLLSIMGFFVWFTLMHMVDSYRLAGLGLSVVALTTAAVYFFVLPQSVQHSPVVLSSDPSGTSAENIRLVDFSQKPNVYLISFDALAPMAILKKYMGLENVAHRNILNEKFRTFRNFFSESTTTKESLNLVLSLDKGHYFSSKQKHVQNGYFQGLTPSPLFEIFKRNGYETNTIFESLYFGTKKGPYVDNYFTKKKLLLCEWVPRDHGFYLFLGYCGIQHETWFQSFLEYLGGGVARMNEVDFLITKLRQGLAKKTPQVFLGYVYSPGHTWVGFDYNKEKDRDKYRGKYVSNSRKTAAYTQKIITFVEKEDPGSLLYVFGDHGLWLSRGMDFNKNKTFFIQDRFAVFGGIFPKDRCRESFSRSYTESFMTVLQGMHMIIRCLSGGKNAFRKLGSYTLVDGELPQRGKYRHEDFLYE